MGYDKRRTDLGRVVGGTKDQLGRPVVPRANVRDIGFVFDQNFGGAEIAEFQDTGAGVQEEVLRLNITMADAL